MRRNAGCPACRQRHRGDGEVPPEWPLLPAFSWIRERLQVLPALGREEAHGGVHGEHGETGAEDQRHFANACRCGECNDEHQDEGFDALEGRRSKPPDGLRDDGEHEGLDPQDDARSGRSGAVAHVCPGEGDGQRRRGQDEAEAGRPEAAPPCAGRPQVHGHLGRIRARDQVRDAEHVDEFLVRCPVPFTSEFAPHDRDVGSRPPECDHAEAEEIPRNFADRAAG